MTHVSWCQSKGNKNKSKIFSPDANRPYKGIELWLWINRVLFAFLLSPSWDFSEWVQIGDFWENSVQKIFLQILPLSFCSSWGVERKCISSGLSGSGFISPSFSQEANVLYLPIPQTSPAPPRLGNNDGLLRTEEESSCGIKTLLENLLNVYCLILFALVHWKLNYSSRRVQSFNVIIRRVTYEQSWEPG